MRFVEFLIPSGRARLQTTEAQRTQRTANCKRVRSWPSSVSTVPLWFCSLHHDAYYPVAQHCRIEVHQEPDTKAGELEICNYLCGVDWR